MTETAREIALRLVARWAEEGKAETYLIDDIERALLSYAAETERKLAEADTVIWGRATQRAKERPPKGWDKAKVSAWEREACARHAARQKEASHDPA